MARTELDEEIEEQLNRRKNFPPLEVKHTHRHLEIVSTWIEKNCKEPPVRIKIPPAEESRKISQPIAEAKRQQCERETEEGTEVVIAGVLRAMVDIIKRERQEGRNYADPHYDVPYDVHLYNFRNVQIAIADILHKQGYWNNGITVESRRIYVSLRW